jgi:tellurite resistance protein TerC
MSETLFFLVFSIGVIFVMLVDLGVFKKSDAEEVSFREAGFGVEPGFYWPLCFMFF